MYARCGDIDRANAVFDQLFKECGSLLDLRVWNAIIWCCSLYGKGYAAINLFKNLCKEGILLTEMTFAYLLSACSISLLPDKLLEYIRLMEDKFNLKPWVVHHRCVVGGLCSANQLEGAEKYLQSLKEREELSSADLFDIFSYYRKCLVTFRRSESSFKPSRKGFSKALLSNLHTSERLLEEVSNISATNENSESQKDFGVCSINIDGKEHVFAANMTHPNMKDIQNKLKELHEGVKNFRDSQDLSSAPLEEDSCGHSEQLAIAFGLLNTDPGVGLTIYKTVNICENCHVVIKYISKVLNRVIKVRDGCRWHFFKDGQCSCSSLWPL
eukprot:TRINITY_DN5972_c0_g1_i1.p1 TRINITY_DN5972_c0_g1~~TRINITY_DN5972_c0_g1_i1.p1  ORF type:complete len:327 (-),score=46.14 TRINITY_DN5972_c0_g1_i1:72-1052(-)